MKEDIPGPNNIKGDNLRETAICDDNDILCGLSF